MVWRERKKTGIRADTNFFDGSTCRPWLDPDQIFKSRATRQGRFFVASSPRRKAFSEGRLLHPTCITCTHKQLLPLPLSRPNTCLGRPCSRACRVLFPWGVGIISLPWFQNTIISGKRTHVPPISHFNFLLTGGNATHYTVPSSRLPARLPTLHLYACAPLSYILFRGEFKC